MNIKYLLTAFTITSITLLSSVCASTPEQQGEHHSPKVQVPFLWQMKPKSIGLPHGYLLGTMHDLPIDTFSLDVTEILLGCSTLIVESIGQDRLTYEDLKKLGAMRDFMDGCWTDKLSTEQREKLHKCIDDLNINYGIMPITANYVGYAKPWVAVVMLKIHQIYQLYNMGMDMAISNAARASQKKVLGLESQIDVIQSLGLDKAADELMIAIVKKQINGEFVSSAKSDAAYIAGDLEAMMQEESKIEDNQMLDVSKITDVRNENWVKVFLELCDKGEIESPFLKAVGAAHCKGLINLLDERYEFIRIGNNGLPKDINNSNN